MNIIWNRVCIILLLTALIGCKPSPPSPAPWEKIVVHNLAIPQDACRVWMVAKALIRVVYVFQTDQKGIDHIHSYVNLQNELNEKNPYYGLYTPYIVGCVGMKNDFKKEMEKNPQLKSYVQDFIKENFNDYEILKVGAAHSESPKIELGILYKKLSDNQYLVIIGMAPPKIISKGSC
ncbi:hypothetical protein [Akkermansia massiliensis]|uniref:hypothetical protein n=1 Tax=Akkermansia massiliensis TaxID=2927224 RepID=UPI00202F3D30|nr:hypothetical protein [Akkermansia sp. B2-R-115]